MSIKLGSLDIADVRVGSAQATAVYVGSTKIWPVGGPVFVEEKHYLTPLAGNASVVSGEPLQMIGWGWTGVMPLMPLGVTKIYLEITYLSRGDADGTFANSLLTFEPSDNSAELVRLDTGGSLSGTGSASIGAINPANLPATQRICLDKANGLVWAALEGGDWNGSASANPATGVGGVAFNAATLLGGSIVWYMDDSGSAAMGEIALHAHQFKYTPPAGFGEIVVAGEYA